MPLPFIVSPSVRSRLATACLLALSATATQGQNPLVARDDLFHPTITGNPAVLDVLANDAPGALQPIGLQAGVSLHPSV